MTLFSLEATRKSTVMNMWEANSGHLEQQEQKRLHSNTTKADCLVRERSKK